MENRTRTITILFDILQQDVWFYFKNPETCRRFLEDAEAEGFMFGHIKPTESSTSDIVAVHKNKQMSHLGYTGHMRFYQAISVDDLIRVDYAKYITGEDDLYIRNRTDLEPFRRSES